MRKPKPLADFIDACLGPALAAQGFASSDYGWRCIGRVVLKQGPVERREPKLPAKMPLSADETERLRAAIAPVGEEGLRGALQRLGEGVIGAKSAGSRTKA